MSSSVEIDPYVRDLVRFFVPDNEYEDREKQREDLERRLNDLVEAEAQRIHTGNLVRSLFNAVASTYNASEWARMQDALKPRAVDVILNRLHFDDQGESLEQKAKAVAEFVLRYLITRKSMGVSNTGGPRYIRRNLWHARQMETLGIRELVERAIHGYGRDAPPLPVRDLLHYIREERREMLRLTEALAKMVPEKDAVEASVSLIGELKPVSSVIAGQMIKYCSEAARSIESLAWIDETDSLSYPGRAEALVKIRNQVRSKVREMAAMHDHWIALFNSVQRSDARSELFLVLQGVGKFGRVRLEIILDFMERFLKEHPDPAYQKDPDDPTVADIVYMPETFEKEIDAGRELYKRCEWLKEASGYRDAQPFEVCRDLVIDLFRMIERLEKALIEAEKNATCSTGEENLLVSQADPE